MSSDNHINISRFISKKFNLKTVANYIGDSNTLAGYRFSTRTSR